LVTTPVVWHQILFTAGRAVAAAADPDLTGSFGTIAKWWATASGTTIGLAVVWAVYTKKLRLNREVEALEKWFTDALEKETEYAQQMKQERDDWRRAYLEARGDTARAIETTKTAVEAAATTKGGSKKDA
jgi:hypothetical protein